jgi:type II secretory pathway pseudopilin PulG
VTESCQPFILSGMHPKTLYALRTQRGSAYLVVMLAVVVMSISITAAAKQWKTVVQREKEADLLARGIEIQTAIGAYYAARQKPLAQSPQNLQTPVAPSAPNVQPGSVQTAVEPGWYPLTLEELTKGPKPLLRKVYKDPMTGEDWEYVRDAVGRIRGVRSQSKLTPIKQHQFPPQVATFEGLTQYHDWVFQHAAALTPPQAVGQPPQGGTGTEPKQGETNQPPSGPVPTEVKPLS